MTQPSITIDEDTLYVRNICPPTCNSVTGTGAGSCCKATCWWETPTTELGEERRERCCPCNTDCSEIRRECHHHELPPLPPPNYCSTRVTVNNLSRYRVRSGGTHIRVC